MMDLDIASRATFYACLIVSSENFVAQVTIDTLPVQDFLLFIHIIKLSDVAFRAAHNICDCIMRNRTLSIPKN
ncbi:hypothetical protein C443_03149 [Haloarcula argentinensis DSM 12282]|nr:hypothetical protein C443_03149 [Haloarcula argentinensis DSM 12282]